MGNIAGKWTSHRGEIFDLEVRDSFISGHLQLRRGKYLKIPVHGLVDVLSNTSKACFYITSIYNQAGHDLHQSIMFSGNFTNYSTVTIKYLHYKHLRGGKEVEPQAGQITLKRIYGLASSEAGHGYPADTPFDQFITFVNNKVWNRLLIIT